MDLISDRKMEIMYSYPSPSNAWLMMMMMMVNIIHMMIRLGVYE